LDRATITARLTDLAEELAVRDTRAELYVVGGAALALAYDTRRATRDIDAVFEPKAVVYEAATAVASRRGLPDGWLNDAVKGLVPAGDETAVPVLDLPSLKVSAASPRYLLAMKVAAARVDRDQADIVSLAALCGAATADEVLGIVVDVWGTTAILTPKSQFLVEELFP
jgi:hypothetical protein